ncbi:PEP-CTERM putative exosortase interaction domain-containing protein [Nostoc sp. PCC 7524]|uniref:PEP-CTERM sorting domain-containing protein n=1 Tax=Nostoc sp. (strain ATCC 29411 / PCC 7524) TaxID=28072 RepID=UPI00029F075A|nr:PEP-CTERM sorting domain-containing protein [Nostoc sp. PCC 7524]AFY49530.1 PEP-CTERM putative exosortase interaction domain-containing protein [Nostoc sp. PCC 7524]
MKFVKQLVFTAASLALCFSAVDVKSASAVIVNYAFSVDSPTKTGKGFFSFDDSTFSSGSFPEAIVKSLTFQFDGDSNIYTEKDDTAYPDFPVVFLSSSSTGKPIPQLSYFFFDKTSPDKFFYEIVGEDLTILDGEFQNTEIGFGKVSYTKVPEPATMLGVMLVSGLSLIVGKKAKSVKKVAA